MRGFTDPRHYQLAVLASLLVYGLTALDFDIGAVQVVLTLVSVLAAQYACTRVWRLPAFEPRSALISGLSLCLLLRTDVLWLVPVAAVVTIASKFVVVVGRKHVFNPTNLGLVAMLILSDRVWVSPGQWGNVAFFAFLMACLGGLVAYRALRSDVALTFLAVYAGLVVGRSLHLGEPMAIPLHRLQSGALLLFTFFMISDPRTTPDARPARLLFGTLVAFGAWYVQFRLFRTNGLLWALAACAPLVPILDRVWRAEAYRWPSASPGAAPSPPACVPVSTPVRFPS
jgi:Na+-transporting NADH:ubiquinone oxidoreductase subunit NqrB